MFLLDVGAVGVGWVFVRLAESLLWSSLGFLLVSSLLSVSLSISISSFGLVGSSSSIMSGSASMSSSYSFSLFLILSVVGRSGLVVLGR